MRVNGPYDPHRGSFTPHFSNNNFFTGWWLLTRIAMGPWSVDRFCFGRLWSWSRVQSRDNPYQIFSKRQTGITVLWMLHDDVIKWKHFFVLLVLCEGNPPPVNEGFPSQRPVKRSFNIFYLRINKRLKANSRDDGASRHHRAHYDVTVNDLRNKKVSMIWAQRF